MSYRVTSIEALRAHLAVTGSTLLLCSANLGSITMSEEEREDALRRIDRQIAELNAMRLKIARPRKKAFRAMFDTQPGAMRAANDSADRAGCSVASRDAVGLCGGTRDRTWADV